MQKLIPLEVQKIISEVCTEIENLLIEKNAAYGNSAIYPINIFSKGSALEQICVRIDDKLNRIKQGQTNTIIEDTVLDLIGYLILLKVLERITNK